MNKTLYTSFLLIALISCGGGNTISYSADELDQEISRTNALIEEADSYIASMQDTYSPELVTKLSRLSEDLVLFDGVTNYRVPSKVTQKCEKQVEKVYKETVLIEKLLDEYNSLSGYMSAYADASEKAEQSLSEFLVGFNRDNYEEAMAQVANLKPQELSFDADCLKKIYNDTKSKADSLYTEYMAKLKDNEKNVKISLFSNSNLLLDAPTKYPYYLNKSDVLYVYGSADNATEIKVWDANSKKLLKSFGRKAKYNEAIIIPNTSIYIIEVVATTSTYFDINFAKTTSSDLWDKIYTIKQEDVECGKNDFMAVAVTTIEVQPLFQEPRKITLKSGIGSWFGGSTMSSVALNIPPNTTDVAYQIRISTSKGSKSRDGEFCANLESKTNQIKLFGLNVYENKKQSSSLIREILNEMTKPEREEEAYCSMYIFYDANSAKKFQDGTASKTQLRYDVNYSIQGTQSTNGAIPISSAKNIYLCFNNDRGGANVYIWLEAAATVNVTKYWRTIYTLED